MNRRDFLRSAGLVASAIALPGGARSENANPGEHGDLPMPSVADADARIAELGLELPPYRDPLGTFVHAVESQGMIYLAGHPPIRADGTVVFGKLGRDLDTKAGQEAARVAALGMLTTLRHHLGTLNRVRRLVRVFGVVNATEDFTEHTQVINGASDLLVEVFGDAGRHARLAVGMSSLPHNIALETELTAEIET